MLASNNGICYLLHLLAIVGRGYAIVLMVYVCLLVCQQDYCKSNEVILLKLGCYYWAYQWEESVNVW